MKIKHIIAVVVATIFTLTAVCVFAAEDPWFIIKDKNFCHRLCCLKILIIQYASDYFTEIVQDHRF